MQANRTFMKLLLVLLLGAVAGSSAAQSRDNAFTLYAAYRDGGSFTDATTGKTLPIEASGAGSVSLDLGLDAGRQVQLYLSRQNSQISVEQTGAPPSKLPMKVTYLHIGGTNFLDGKIGRGVYLVGGLGDYLAGVEDASWAVRTYGPTAVTALVAIVHAQYALFIDSEHAGEHRDRGERQQPLHDARAQPGSSGVTTARPSSSSSEDSSR